MLPKRSGIPGQEFSPFSRLPKELRILIWEAAIPDPRILHLGFYGDSGLRSQTPSPSLLSVCRESLEVMSKFYTKTFGTVLSAPITWFDFQRDTLYIDTGLKNFLPLLLLDAIHVKDLAIYAESPRQDRLYKWVHNNRPSTFRREASRIVFKEPLLQVQHTEEKRLDEAKHYDGPCSQTTYSDLARESVGESPPIDFKKLRILRDFVAKNRLAASEAKLEKLRGLLVGKKATPSIFEAFEKLKDSLAAIDRQPWTMPEEISFRVATDPEGLRQLCKRGQHMMKWGIVSGDKHAYTDTEQFLMDAVAD
ncbi:hypothetical protein EG329_000217 [Mollisiaceae sp. DMI_Dod_QoI]|nr:hypothetical protein EG329_000217 [Helotiales sp. DMI_Dod_QoI]